MYMPSIINIYGYDHCGEFQLYTCLSKTLVAVIDV